MENHITAIHTGQRDFKCGQERSDFASVTKSDLQCHMWMHAGIKSFTCSFDLCEYRSTQKSTMVNHERTHTGERYHSCLINDCDKTFIATSTRDRHMRSLHVKENQMRQKKMEFAVMKYLKENSFNLDDEVHIRYNESVVNADKAYARIDLFVCNITAYVVILEIDEKAHRFYEVRCEQTRMLQIDDALRKGGIAAPVVFIRFNPDGLVTRDGQKFTISQEERLEYLKQYLTSIVDGDVIFSDPINLVYLFYPTQDALPTVCQHDDYELQGLVRFVK
ncbi:hypothetical protein JKP88DRAFT_307823 [Tribonema minus]|uniref:C2H2-type domain-containing protein n=1 Tax=Tribonema minus TaxID=303371 RepID=A0A836CIF6_9STRA|nr:hypothetical protein JKP88DRAFT_307823 [Tribonema minus]